MRSKGFTLIELLAVIVILAIIALIATPIVLNIISDVKKESNERSLEMYTSAVKNSIATYKLNNPTYRIISGTFTTTDGKTLTNGKKSLTIDYEGDIQCGVVVIYEDGNIYLAECKINGKKVDYTYATSKELVPKSFAEDSWETIIANVKVGNLSKYKVGDTKEIELKNFGKQTIRISNTSTPDDCNTEGFSQTACGFVIEFANGIIGYNMNPSNTNVGGWQESLMRIYVNSTIYNALPQELIDNIIETTVVSSHGKIDSSNFISTDKLYLLSLKEVWGNETYRSEDKVKVKVDELISAAQTTRQLDYYLGISLSEPNRAIKKFNGASSIWWLRGCIKHVDEYFNVIHSSGLYTNSGANRYNSDAVVSPAFRIG